MTRAEKTQTRRAAPILQRIDKWLWCARLFKTRTIAAKVVAAGGVRLTRDGATTRIGKASLLVKAGDRLAYMNGERLRVVEILACGARRGPAPEARLLFSDQSPREAPPPGSADRQRGAGRPTKKDRRAIDRLNEAG